MSLTKLALSLFVFTSLVIGCGEPESETRSINLSKVFVHGDPASLIAGTQQNASVPFNESNIDAFSDFSLFGGQFFTGSSDVGNRSTAEEGNETSTQSEADHSNRSSSYDFRWEGDQALFTSDDSETTLRFDTTTDPWTFAGLEIAGQRVSANLKHISLKADRSAFSVLLETNDSDFQGLLALYFTRNKTSAPLFTRASTDYQYLLGPGIAAGWAEGEIKFSICGQVTSAEEKAIERGITSWSSTLSQAGIELSVSRNQTPPPFTDLQDNICLYMVDNYFFEDQSNAVVYGMALTVVNFSNRRILSSSILMSTEGFAKAERALQSRADFPTMLSFTTSHEVGHALGLGHQFDERFASASIMSYEFVGIEDPTPRWHDQSALLGIYQQHSQFSLRRPTP